MKYAKSLKKMSASIKKKKTSVKIDLLGVLGRGAGGTKCNVPKVLKKNSASMKKKKFFFVKIDLLGV